MFFLHQWKCWCCKLIDEAYSVQIKALTVKLTRVKYRRPLTCLDGDIRILTLLGRVSRHGVTMVS
jgi:hypothetical protein